MKKSLAEFCLEAGAEALLGQWEQVRNAPMTPETISYGSKQKVWWQCADGHAWQAQVKSRVSGCGCPLCANKVVEPERTDLATVKPELAAQWHPEKNGSLTPESVTPYSNRRVWWRCPAGHEYQAMISARSSSGSGCPYCKGRKVMPGFNDLASQQPKVAAEWAQDLNGALTPEMVTTGSHKKVWWRCGDGHVWRAVVFSRARGNFCGCPICAGKVKRRSNAFAYAAYTGGRVNYKEENRE